jgi:hypothetical protein
MVRMESGGSLSDQGGHIGVGVEGCGGCMLTVVWCILCNVCALSSVDRCCYWFARHRISHMLHRRSRRHHFCKRGRSGLCPGGFGELCDGAVAFEGDIDV